MRGYRGFVREFSRTGTLRALSLQTRTGIVHVLGRLLGSKPTDAIERFLDNYGPDGIRPVADRDRELQLRAERCLVCGLCSAECARVGGQPRLDPRDAVVAASRLEVDLLRHDLGGLLAVDAGACAGCDACARVCPTGIPIPDVQARLGRLARLRWPAGGASGAAAGSGEDEVGPDGSRQTSESAKSGAPR